MKKDFSAFAGLPLETSPQTQVARLSPATTRQSAKDEFSSPVDVPGDGLPSALRWTSTVIVTAALVLALGDAAAIDNWAQNLPDSPVKGPVIVASRNWLDLTKELHLARPAETVRTEYDRINAARFSE
jgi:hypothetical protein